MFTFCRDYIVNFPMHEAMHEASRKTGIKVKGVYRPLVATRLVASKKLGSMDESERSNSKGESGEEPRQEAC